MFISLILLLEMIVFGLIGIIEVKNVQNCNFCENFLAPEILTPTELGSVGAPQHHYL